MSLSIAARKKFQQKEHQDLIKILNEIILNSQSLDDVLNNIITILN